MTQTRDRPPGQLKPFPSSDFRICSSTRCPERAGHSTYWKQVSLRDSIDERNGLRASSGDSRSNYSAGRLSKSSTRTASDFTSVIHLLESLALDQKGRRSDELRWIKFRNRRLRHSIRSPNRRRWSLRKLVIDLVILEYCFRESITETPNSLTRKDLGLGQSAAHRLLEFL